MQLFGVIGLQRVSLLRYVHTWENEQFCTNCRKLSPHAHLLNSIQVLWQYWYHYSWLSSQKLVDWVHKVTDVWLSLTMWDHNKALSAESISRIGKYPFLPPVATLDANLPYKKNGKAPGCKIYLLQWKILLSSHLLPPGSPPTTL